MTSLMEALQLPEGCEWDGEHDLTLGCKVFPCGLQVADEVAADARPLDSDEVDLIRNAHLYHHNNFHDEWKYGLWTRLEYDAGHGRIVEAGCCDSWMDDKNVAWLWER